jgi:anaphase-promoting complex subunit 4
VGAQGHRRWEKAVTTGYEALRRLTHECLLPALERCGVLLSRLLGLSKFHKLNHVLGLETKDLNECLDTVDCLNLLSHNVLIYSGRELREFAAFSKWLRHEIDLHSADPLSGTVDELIEKSDALEYGQILAYIQGAMTRSSLQDFIQPPAEPEPEPEPERWAPAGPDSSFYETYKKLLQQQAQQNSNDKPSLPVVSDLTARLGSQCDKVFRRIAETQRRGILHRSPLVLASDCDSDVMDMTMNFSVCFFSSVQPAMPRIGC